MKVSPVSVRFDYVRNESIGEVQYCQGARPIIHLNAKNPLLSTRNKEAIMVVACALYANAQAHDEDKAQGDMYKRPEGLQFIEFLTSLSNNIHAFRDETE